MSHGLKDQLRVTNENSKTINGMLYITSLRASQITSKPQLKEVITSNTIVYPGMGKMIEYNGKYIRRTVIM